MDDQPVINGASEYESARKGLLSEVFKQPMDPMQAAISAYANGILQSARVSALVDLVMEFKALPPDAIPPDMNARFEELQTEHLYKTTRDLAAAREGASRIQIAQSLKN